MIRTHHQTCKSTQKQIEINLRHPRKECNCISFQAWQRRKLLGGHYECFEKQALDLSSMVNWNRTVGKITMPPWFCQSHNDTKHEFVLHWVIGKTHVIKVNHKCESQIVYAIKRESNQWHQIFYINQNNN